MVKIQQLKDRLSEWIKNMTQIYVAYKKPTLHIKTLID